MKYALLLSLSTALFLLGGCTLFRSGNPAPSPAATQKPLAVPIGKNWQLVEEAPVLTDGRLPFQMEQSVQPKETRPAPADSLEIETAR